LSCCYSNYGTTTLIPGGDCLANALNVYQFMLVFVALGIVEEGPARQAENAHPLE
jgi:hypothetical protein